jgi:hypothetical protein
MGYRSQVAFIVKFKNTQDRDALWMLYANSDDEGKKEMAQEMEHQYKDPIVTFQHDDIKWYEGYPFVSAAHAFMGDAYEMFNASWRFVRVGEDYNDVDVQGQDDDGDLWDYVDVHRTVNTSFPPLADTSSASSSTPVTSTI